MRRLKIILYCTGIFFIIVAVAGTGLIFHLSSFSRTPVSISPPGVVFHVKPGQPLEQITSNLHNEGVVSSRFLFKLLVRFKGADTRIHAGEYAFSGNITPEQVLHILTSGKVRLHKITVPEGLTIEETGQIFGNAGFCKTDTFSRLARDTGFIRSCGLETDSLEGYLFPETYFFPVQASCELILSTMVQRFHDIYTREWEQKGNDMGFTRHEIVTLASIIEKETSKADERPVISSVFHNRLEKGMKLQSDPTVIYGIDNFDGNITRRHLTTRTPYNTYAIKGLPPGPIASPGKLSIQAALEPESTPFLFFVSRNDGSHYFSKTLKEHNRAVSKYQLNR